ncbi:MAG: hypothetical protein K5981_08745 [Clostridia bacterium]|nr:hypothetical protein [Clostridia bacterium]
MNTIYCASVCEENCERRILKGADIRNKTIAFLKGTDLCPYREKIERAERESKNECCGTCEYHKPAVTFGSICTNPKSFHLADWTDDGDTCSQYVKNHAHV